MQDIHESSFVELSGAQTPLVEVYTGAGTGVGVGITVGTGVGITVGIGVGTTVGTGVGVGTAGSGVGTVGGNSTGISIVPSFCRTSAENFSLESHPARGSAKRIAVANFELAFKNFILINSSTIMT